MISFFLPGPAIAQNSGKDIVREPICFLVVNEAPYSVFGNFGTDQFTRPDGIDAHHRANFRLEPAGTMHEDGYPLDRSEFCSYGPFYEGRKLELTLRTLIPIFSCKTRIDQGPIVIKGKKQDDGTVETWAECYL